VTARPVLSASERPGREAKSTLTPQQHRAIDLLLAASTHRNAASALKVSERTLRRWLALPAFQGELSGRARLLRQTANLSLTFGAAGAAKSLVAMAIGSVAPNAARISACRAVLELLERAGELEAVLDRVAELEQLVRSADIGGNEVRP
jgi:hypothetical protein